MTHMVIFESPEGNPGYHQTDGLDDAVRFVEGLRNDQDVERARIFRMEEVPFEFRSYFRVELDGAPVPPPADGRPRVATRTEAFHGTTLRRVDLVDGGRIDLTDDVAPPRADDDIAGAVARRGLFGR